MKHHWNNPFFLIYGKNKLDGISTHTMALNILFKILEKKSKKLIEGILIKWIPFLK